MITQKLCSLLCILCLLGIYQNVLSQSINDSTKTKIKAIIEYLDLFDNEIDTLNIKPGDLKHLKNINLCYNKFKRFPIELTHLSSPPSLIFQSLNRIRNSCLKRLETHSKQRNGQS